MNGLTNLLNKDKAEQAEQAPVVEQTDILEAPVTRWSSHPIQRYTMGYWTFEKGLLVLTTQEEADRFQAEYEKLPVSEQTRIQKLDLAAAEEIVRQSIAMNGGATKSFDSSTGDRAPNNQTGTGRLEDG